MKSLVVYIVRVKSDLEGSRTRAYPDRTRAKNYRDSLERMNPLDDVVLGRYVVPASKEDIIKMIDLLAKNGLF